MVFVVESEDGERFSSDVRIADASGFDYCAYIGALESGNKNVVI